MGKLIDPLENAWLVNPSTTVPDPNVKVVNTNSTAGCFYKNMHFEHELNYHCDCGKYVEPEWKYCPFCGNKLWQRK